MNDVDTRIMSPEGIRAEWQDLASRVDASPFMRPGWVLGWQDAFGTGRLQLVTAWRKGRLSGVLPMSVKRGLLSSPTNWHTPEFTVVADGPDVYDALVAAAVDAARWQLQLSFVDQDTVDSVTSIAQRMGRPTHARVLEQSPHIPMRGWTFEDYAARLPRHTQSEIRRRRRKLEEVGPVSLEVHETAEDEALSQFLAVEHSGWKAQQGTSIAQDGQAAAFYPTAARWAAQEGWLRLALLKAGDQVIAGDLSIQAYGVHYLLKTGYDEEYRAFGPGKILRLDMIERAFADGLNSYEFLGDNDAWKQEWTKHLQQRMRVQVFGRGPAGRMVQAGQMYGRPAAKRLVDRVGQWRSHR
jgi:CelD/BcsL family acetyltransferase involved in cellulose biosynthesis